jgi:HSP20 family protein
MAQDVLNRESHNGVHGDTFTPRVDIFEADNELVLFADLPGVKPEDLDLHFEKGELILRAACPPRTTGGFARQEYGVGDFYRAFTVAEDVDADKIAAELKNGVLTVRLPKAEKAQPRKIQVAG